MIKKCFAPVNFNNLPLLNNKSDDYNNNYNYNCSDDIVINFNNIFYESSNDDQYILKNIINRISNNFDKIIKENPKIKECLYPENNTFTKILMDNNDSLKIAVTKSLVIMLMMFITLATNKEINLSDLEFY